MAEAKRDYYEVLGVSRDADEATLKKAYRQVAKKYHPDMKPGDAEAERKFKEASEAYAILSDPEKRRQYDQFGHAAFEGGAGGAGGFGGFDFSGADFSDIFGDIFGDLFGGGRRGRASQGPMKGMNIRKSVRITFECLAARKSWTLSLKIPAPSAAAPEQNRGLLRLPVQNAAAKARWSSHSSPSLEQFRMYRLVRTATAPARSSKRNVRIAAAPDMYPTGRPFPYPSRQGSTTARACVSGRKASRV